MRAHYVFAYGLATLALATPSPAPAADQNAPTAARSTPDASAAAEPVIARGRADPLDRGVPRSAMQGYLEAARAGDWERAAERSGW
jgi:hypothetical protein